MYIKIYKQDKNNDMDNYLQRQFITFDKNPHRVSHKLVCHLKDFMWKGGRNQGNLNLYKTS